MFFLSTFFIPDTYFKLYFYDYKFSDNKNLIVNLFGCIAI